MLLFTEAPPELADFEKAIESTGYGKFNYLILLIAMPCCFSSVFETTTMSLILPSAECDLNLSLVDKGILNAITYGGMQNCQTSLFIIESPTKFGLVLDLEYTKLFICRNDFVGILVGVFKRRSGEKEALSLRLSTRWILQYFMRIQSVLFIYHDFQIHRRVHVSDSCLSAVSDIVAI